MKMLTSTEKIEKLIDETLWRYPEHHSMIRLAHEARAELAGYQMDIALTKANTQ